MSVSGSIPSAQAYRNEPVRHPALKVIDLLGEARAMTGPSANVVLSQVNQHCLRLAVLEGEYPWHYHAHSDELFLVLEGHLFIDFPDAPTLRIDPGQAVTVPAGTVHRTRTDTRVVNACFEELGADTEFVPAPADWVRRDERPSLRQRVPAAAS
ncbi:MAG: cupin domain-containing protein [Gemmatimonadales bacterium]